MDYRSWNYLRNKKLVVIEWILIYGMGIDVYCLMFFLGVGVCTRASSPTWGWLGVFEGRLFEGRARRLGFEMFVCFNHIAFTI